MSIMQLTSFRVLNLGLEYAGPLSFLINVSVPKVETILHLRGKLLYYTGLT